MNPGEIKQYLDEQLHGLGWSVQIDMGSYERIHQHTRGDKDQLVQLYHRLVAIGSQRPKREIDSADVNAAIDNLTRMPETLGHVQNKSARNNHNHDHDRLSIDQLAQTLELTAAPELQAERKITASAITSKPRGNGAQPAGGKVADSSSLPTILVVDDSPTTQAVVAKALANHFKIIRASNGEEAWRHLIANDEIDLVITDLMMPILDGFDLIQRIRSDKAPPRVVALPVLVMTSAEDPNAKARVLVAGADDFIAKKTDTAELQSRVFARYKVAQSKKHKQSVMESQARRFSSQTPNSATPAHPTNASESASALHAASSSKPSAQPSARANPAQRRVANGRKPETGQPERQHAAMPEQDLFSPARVNQSGPISSKKKSRFNSNVTITLAATVLVALIIGGISYMERRPSIAKERVELAQANASTAKGRIDADQQQPLSTQAVTTELSKPASEAPLADSSPKTVPGAETLKDKTTPPEEARSLSTGGLHGLPEKPASSRPENAATLAESAGHAHETKRLNHPAGAGRTKPSVAEAESTKTLSRPKKPIAEKSAPNVIAAVPATTPVAPARPTTALPGPDEHKPASVAAADGTSPGPAPVPAQPPQQSGSNNSSVAMLDRNAANSTIVTIAPGSASGNISQTELVTLVRRFVHVYDAGDLDQFLSLFTKDVRTNDRNSKAGLRADYQELFQTTDMRNLSLGTVTWELNGNEAHGWGNFDVKVRKIGVPTVKAFHGSLTFHVEKHNGELLIKQLYYGQWRTAGQ